MAMVHDSRDGAVRRLETALIELDRSREGFGDAIGTPHEFEAHRRLETARNQVAGLQAWLKSIEEPTGGGRVWINGREVGGPDSCFLGLEDSHD